MQTLSMNYDIDGGGIILGQNRDDKAHILHILWSGRNISVVSIFIGRTMTGVTGNWG